MLSKTFRLTGKETFAKLKKEGKKIFGETLTLVYRAREDEKNSKIGIIVSLKISKRAVDRNKVKRLIREAVRRDINDLKSGIDLVFLTKRNILKLDQEGIFTEVNKLLRKANLLK